MQKPSPGRTEEELLARETRDAEPLGAEGLGTITEADKQRIGEFERLGVNGVRDALTEGAWSGAIRTRMLARYWLRENDPNHEDARRERVDEKTDMQLREARVANWIGWRGLSLGIGAILITALIFWNAQCL